MKPKYLRSAILGARVCSLLSAGLFLVLGAAAPTQAADLRFSEPLCDERLVAGSASPGRAGECRPVDALPDWPGPVMASPSTEPPTPPESPGPPQSSEPPWLIPPIPLPLGGERLLSLSSDYCKKPNDADAPASRRCESNVGVGQPNRHTIYYCSAACTVDGQSYAATNGHVTLRTWGWGPGPGGYPQKITYYSGECDFVLGVPKDCHGSGLWHPVSGITGVQAAYDNPRGFFAVEVATE